MSKNKDLHEALAKPENDHEFKMHVLSKLDQVDDLKHSFDIFKIKAYAVITLIISAKEVLIRKFF